MKKSRKKLDEILKLCVEKQKHTEKEEIARIQKREKAEKEFFSNEEKVYENKLRLYQSILAWKEEFIASEQFKGIANIKTNICGHIILYYSYWGHEYNKNSHGCWSRITLTKEGELIYSAGYKWMPTGPTFNFNDASIAERLSHKYLAEFNEHLQSGKVYEQLVNEFKKYL